MKKITMIANNDLPNMRIVKGDKLVVLETSKIDAPGAYIIVTEGECIVTDDLKLIGASVVIGKVVQVVVEL